MWFFRIIGLITWCGIVSAFFVKYCNNNYNDNYFYAVWLLMIMTYYLITNILAVINLKYLYSADNKNFEQAALNETKSNKLKVIMHLVFIAIILVTAFFVWNLGIHNNNSLV